MAIGYTELDFVNGSAPALSAENLNHIDEALKDACDLLDAETAAGRALVEAADAAAQRSALGLGDCATKNVGTGAGDVAAGNAPAAAQAAAEATAAGALAGHVADADPHPQYAQESALGNAATKNVGTGASDVAAGNAPAGAVTTHESTYAHANLPTANEKTRLGDIQAATGATTALKLANLTTAATTSQQGVSLLGASGGAAKLTDRPDGDVAPAYSSNFATTDSWQFATNGALSVSGGKLIFTASAASGRYFGRDVSGSAGKQLYLSYQSPVPVTVTANNGATTVAVIPASPYRETLAVLPMPATITNNRILLTLGNGTAADVVRIGAALVGDYSMLDGSMLLETARVANELAVTQGVGVAASGTITATDLATAGKGDTIHGKKYTFVDALTASPGVEGEVLKAATKEEEIENENLAISEVSRANNGVKYWAAAVHPLVSTTRSGAVLNLSAKNPGLSGNRITVTCESGTNHTASGSTLTGGKDAVGDKIKTQLNAAIGAGAAVGAIPTKTATSIIGYFAVADCASGAQVTLPAGGTWAWEVTTYGATYNSVKSGTAAGGAAITGTASANLCMRYERIA